MTESQTIRLNCYVALCIDEESHNPLGRETARQGTVNESRAYAHSIGIPPDEIAGAVEAAIKQATKEE